MSIATVPKRSLATLLQEIEAQDGQISREQEQELAGYPIADRIKEALLKSALIDDLEAKIATFPTIAVPTITLEGDANGAPHLEPPAYAAKFSGKYQHRLITGGIGHNLPQEAPDAFARAVLDAVAL